MIRTVKSFKIVYADVAFNEAGELNVVKYDVEIPTTNREKALKLFQRKHGEHTIVSVEEKNTKYFLSDGEFFKYARKVEEK